MMVSAVRNVLDSKLEVARSKWDKGVIETAFDVLDYFKDNEDLGLQCKDVLLNGASSEKEYVKGGCALIYTGDIIERFCTAGEIKNLSQKKRQDDEYWLNDVMYRGVHQAMALIYGIVRKHTEREVA